MRQLKRWCSKPPFAPLRRSPASKPLPESIASEAANGYRYGGPFVASIAVELCCVAFVHVHDSPSRVIVTRSYPCLGPTGTPQQVPQELPQEEELLLAWCCIGQSKARCGQQLYACRHCFKSFFSLRDCIGVTLEDEPTRHTPSASSRYPQYLPEHRKGGTIHAAQAPPRSAFAELAPSCLPTCQQMATCLRPSSPS